MVQFSEETKERVSKVIDVSRRILASDRLPGYATRYTYSDPKPTLFRLFSPLA
ncbi:uncharacterized protein N7506_007072 [Penicillium brevicompactum]|uniref:uncharacterized protein n=1 Tax=Penicillium brevicompactum TaxID=5074 RepID=UPI002540682B|nr:uncharacterized protein N7506_007072 [Penicillium brevicompactum]KAJ5333289.1 hypothetical protein N7506_007072 [Penicillium brevicompactum]